MKKIVLILICMVSFSGAHAKGSEKPYLILSTAPCELSSRFIEWSFYKSSIIKKTEGDTQADTLRIRSQWTFLDDSTTIVTRFCIEISPTEWGFIHLTYDKASGEYTRIRSFDPDKYYPVIPG